MLELRSAGMGAVLIARTLNTEGTGNPRTGKSWNYGTVHRILRTAEKRRLGVCVTGGF